ncbi:MAG: hypothetical protein NVS2B16_22750 [Chloroflexota bacterium]
MYEFMILGTLARFSPLHGYKIAKVLGNVIGPFKHVQWGSLYPVLARLEAEGLICAEERVDDEAGSRRAYAITDAGRKRLHAHLMDTEHHLGEYSAVFTQKVALFSFLSPEERRFLSRHYAVYAHQVLDHLERKHADVQANAMGLLAPDQIENIMRVMDHKIAVWRAELAWAEELINQSQADAVPS